MKNKFPKLRAALFRGAAADEQSINEIRVAMGLDNHFMNSFLFM